MNAPPRHPVTPSDAASARAAASNVAALLAITLLVDGIVYLAILELACRRSMAVASAECRFGRLAIRSLFICARRIGATPLQLPPIGERDFLLSLRASHGAIAVAAQGLWRSDVGGGKIDCR